MTLQAVLADIYQRLGATPPPDAGFQVMIADVYARLGLVAPPGLTLKYLLDDIYAHLEVREAGLSAHTRLFVPSSPGVTAASRRAR
jgi:hypothetical protein